MTTENYSPMHPAKQLLYLFMALAGCATLGYELSRLLIACTYGTWTLQLVEHMGVPKTGGEITAFRIFLTLTNTVFFFLAPTIFFGYLIVRRPGYYLKTNSSPQWMFAFLGALVLVIILSSLPGIEYSGNLNQQLKLPAALDDLQKLMKGMEESVQRMEAVVLNMKTLWDFILTLIIMAFLPAISEEFFFRGAMQTIFSQWTKNIHLAVWITAFIFSFMHFEFFGFLPRLLIGAILGYLVAWTGNIWMSVLGHFINNGLIVLTMYLFQHKLSSINPDNNHLFNTPVYLFSTLITVILLVVYKKLADAKLQLPDDYD